MTAHPLHTLFNPQSIAVLGASPDPGSAGGRVLANLGGSDFAGPVLAVNPKHQEVHGRPCVPDLASADADIDLAVIATPAPTVSGLLRECGEAGIGTAIVLSAGFGETGADGKRAEAALADAARRAGVRFVGPNCLGMIRPGMGINATFLEQAPPPGRLALISQSGALCSAIVDWAGPHRLGFSTVVSLGNAADIGFGDLIDYHATDPETDAILVYVEGVRRARAFVSALRAAARVKPVIVLKAGRSGGGSKAATTHTGALIGSDAVFDAVLERTGAVRAQTFGQLFAAASLLSSRRRAKGDRLAIVTNGGGAGVLAADRAAELGIELATLSEPTVARLDGSLPAYWSHGNPVDILGDAPPGRYAEAVAACLGDGQVDGILAMLTPQAMSDPLAAAEAVLETVQGAPAKPVLACWMGEARVAEARARLADAGIPSFTTPERGVEAFSYLARHDLNRQLALEVPGPLSDLAPPDVEGARMIVESALAEGREMLSDLESKAVLRAFRIPTNTTLPARSAQEALVAAETVGFPVAMKILSPQIVHKSDVGGVRTGLAAAADLRAAYDEIVAAARAARPDAEITGVTVEAMAPAGAARELVVGIDRDPVFGPVILFGAGGTMVELLADSAVALPPLNSVLAERLIDRTRMARLLHAFRDRPAVDRQAVVEVLLRLSDLASELPHVRELDINPLFAGPEGALAIDARIRVARPPVAAGAYGHMAIAPYPRDLVEEHTLADGTRVTIRPIRPEDAAIEQAFVSSLSPQAKHFRFMQAMDELSPQMLARFTQIDYGREMALIATRRQKAQEVEIGVARYVANPDERSCEFAVAVADEARNLGIGSKLMLGIMRAARMNRFEVMEGRVLADNAPMLTLMQEFGFSLSRAPDEPDVYAVERAL